MALVLNSLVDLLDLLHVHAELTRPNSSKRQRRVHLVAGVFFRPAAISGSPLCWFRVLTWQTLLRPKTGGTLDGDRGSIILRQNFNRAGHDRAVGGCVCQ